MDNKTIRNVVMKRCPEIYFISSPSRHKGKVYWVMFAKVHGIKRPVELHCDMPDTAILSHRELLNTMVSEIYDELRLLKSGAKSLKDHPDQAGMPPLSEEGQKVFDSPDIQYMDVGAPNVNPNKSSLILPP